MAIALKNSIRILLLTLLFIVCGNSTMASQHSSYKDWTTSATNSEPNKSGSAIISQQPRQQTVVFNIHETARVCNTEPVRTLFPWEQTAQKRLNISSISLFKLQRKSFCNYRGYGSSPSHAMLPMPPCLYYIFALRQLLC